MMKKKNLRRWLASDSFADRTMANMITDWVAI
jgi:hypothetical protein